MYASGPVTLCFTEEATGGPEILLHIPVQFGDAAYPGVRLGDSVSALIEALEQQNTAREALWAICCKNCEAIGYGCAIRYAEQDGCIMELELFAFV